MLFSERLGNYVQASFPCLSIQTTEEARAMADVLATAKKLGRGVLTWSCTEGVKRVLPKVERFDDTNDLGAALGFFAAKFASKGSDQLQDALVVLRDPHTWPIDRDPTLSRGLKDLMVAAPNAGVTVVVLSPSFQPHETFERLVTVMEYSLPTPEDLKKIAQGIAKSAGKELEISDRLIRAMGGLSTVEAENALSLSFVETGGFDSEVVYREKVGAVKRSGLLTVMAPEERGLAALAGLENLKGWITKRKAAYTAKAKAYGCEEPKGLALVGVQGCGKSLAAKCIGTALGVPALKLDVGSLFNSLVGATEQRTRDMLALAEAMAPCVLFVDEVDKGLAGTMGSGSGDSGVGQRVLGSILNWMQERKAPVFVVMTANRVENLPAELFRKGRFDEIFAVDLPHAQEREACFKIHLGLRGRDIKKFKLAPAIEATEGFSGAEIEQLVKESLFDAFADGEREVEVRDLVVASKATVPLSVMSPEQVNAIRTWCKGKAKPASLSDGDSASSPVPVVETAQPKRRLVGVVLSEEAPAEAPETTSSKKGGGNN